MFQKLKYLKYAIDNRYPLKLKWILDMFTYILVEEGEMYRDEYIKIENNRVYVRIDGIFILFKNDYKDKLFTLTEPIKINKDMIGNLDNDIDTTVGRLIMNYILLYIPFNKKIKYINELFNPDTIIKKYISKMIVIDDPIKGIDVSEYKTFIKAVTYIDGFSEHISVAASKKLLLPPTDIKNKKEKLIKKYEKEYGKDFKKNNLAFTKFDNELAKIDDDFMKDDITYNKIMKGSKKVKISRKKLHLLMGTSGGLSSENINITSSLMEGFNLDPEELAAYFNNARSGSFSRGKETQDGGSFIKKSFRATGSKEIIDTDCGSKNYIKIHFTKDLESMLNGVYMFDKELIKLEPSIMPKYYDKDIFIRSAMGCKLENNLCAKCLGESLRSYKDGIPLLVLNIGGSLLSASLAAFHATDVATVNIDMSAIN